MREDSVEAKLDQILEVLNNLKSGRREPNVGPGPTHIRTFFSLECR